MCRGETSAERLGWGGRERMVRATLGAVASSELVLEEAGGAGELEHRET